MDFHFIFAKIIAKNGTSGGRHERTDSVVISEQETKMEGIQHVSNGRD